MRTREQLKQAAVNIINKKLEIAEAEYYSLLDEGKDYLSVVFLVLKDYKEFPKLLKDNGRVMLGNKIERNFREYVVACKDHGEFSEKLYKILKYIVLKERYETEDPRTLLQEIIEES